MFDRNLRGSLLFLFPCRAVVLGALVMVAGCAGDPNAPVEVTGQITWLGEPLSSGTITLIPLDTGSPTGAAIENGEFTISREHGPTPGQYRVTIEAYLPTGRKLADTDRPGEKVDEMKQVIPAKYNLRSKLQAEITSRGENRLEYALLKN